MLPWSSSGSPANHHLAVDSLHQSSPFHVIYFTFQALCFILTTSITASCFNLCLMSTFLTLSSFVSPPTLLKNLISVTCNLLSFRFCTVQVSHPYSNVGTAIALNALNFVSLFSSLLSKCSNHLRCSPNSVFNLFVA